MSPVWSGRLAGGGGQLLSVATTTMGDLDQVDVLLAMQALVPGSELP